MARIPREVFQAFDDAVEWPLTGGFSVPGWKFELTENLPAEGVPYLRCLIDPDNRPGLYAICTPDSTPSLITA